MRERANSKVVQLVEITVVAEQRGDMLKEAILENISLAKRLAVNSSSARTDPPLGMTGANPRTRIKGYEAPPREDVEIEKANIIISVGRGVEKKDNLPVFDVLSPLVAGAVLAGSGPVIDSDWLPKGRQVEASGKTVRPKLYIAFGISGAIQHLSGMLGSDFIVAINKERDVPIFNVANVGIAGDMFKVAPAIINEIRK